LGAPRIESSKSSSTAIKAIGLIVVIALVGYYVIPAVVNSFVYRNGIADHKKIGHGSDSNGEPTTWYTVSVILNEDDPINHIHSGEALAYIVSKSDWEMIEWGDKVKIQPMPEDRARIVDVFPSLKPAFWRPDLGVLNIELTPNKSNYSGTEKALFNMKITLNSSMGWPVNLTLFTAFPFWSFIDGYRVFASQSNRETHNITMNPGEEMNISFEWDLKSVSGVSLPAGTYYVRAYLGYYSVDLESTLTATTVIGIQA
jgi:hypothetical protein